MCDVNEKNWRTQNRENVFDTFWSGAVSVVLRSHAMLQLCLEFEVVTVYQSAEYVVSTI